MKNCKNMCKANAMTQAVKIFLFYYYFGNGIYMFFRKKMQFLPNTTTIESWFLKERPRRLGATCLLPRTLSHW